MDHVEDVTPHELRHAAIPNDTVDDLTSKNLLSLAVLTNFVRHAAEYGQTLTKLVKQAGTQGEATISKAYNLLINEGYLGRVEFGYERPAGDTGRSGRRATYQFVSRVPIPQERLEEIIRAYTPGRYVLVPIGTGQLDERGQEIHELRRVKVLSAEIYCHLGAMRIDREGLLSEHTNRRGGRAKARSGKRQPADTPDAESRTDENASSTPETAQPPEPGNPGSGASSDNTPFSQVPPEPGFPDSGNPGSIKKTTPEDQEDQGLPPSAALRLAPGQTPAPPGFTPEPADGEALEVVTTNSPEVGEHLNARGEHGGGGDRALTRDEARELIRKTLRRTA